MERIQIESVRSTSTWLFWPYALGEALDSDQFGLLNPFEKILHKLIMGHSTHKLEASTDVSIEMSAR